MASRNNTGLSEREELENDRKEIGKWWAENLPQEKPVKTLSCLGLIRYYLPLAVNWLATHTIPSPFLPPIPRGLRKRYRLGKHCLSIGFSIVLYVIAQIFSGPSIFC